MELSLTPELESFIEEKVDAGLYQNAREVIQKALYLLQKRDKQEKLKQELETGLRDIEEGKFSQRSVEQIAREVLEKYTGNRIP